MFGKIKQYVAGTALCPVCNGQSLYFNPLPDFYEKNARQHGYAHFGRAEMTAGKTYQCSNCGASDRQRLYAFWMRRQREAGLLPASLKALHFAPEKALSGMMVKTFFDVCHTADLQMDGCDFNVDLMALPFADASYDFFLCSHVLEHVESDDRAIDELYRILKPGGCGILMAPIIVGLAHSFEDPSVTDEAGRWRLYGQNDHVRLYAHDDYVAKIELHGFRVEQLGRSHFGRRVFRRMGLKKTSILYVVHK